MKERRQFNRITVPIPIRLETIELGRKKVLDLNTRDLSASGTFVATLTSFPEGTRLMLDFTMPNDSIKKLKYIKRLNGYTGSMVRSTPHGLAIQFDRECQIESLKAI